MIIINYELFKKGLLQGCQDYLDGKTLIGDPDGFIHSQGGKNRAENLKFFLNTLARTNEDILVAAYAACAEQPTNMVGQFFSFFNCYPGASSRLAGLVGEALIHGHYMILANEVTNSLTSQVFSEEAMTMATSTSAMSVSAVGDMTIAHYRKASGLRIVLDAELETLPAEQAARIRDRARVLQKEWVKPIAQAQNLLANVAYPVPKPSTSSSAAVQAPKSPPSFAKIDAEYPASPSTSSPNAAAIVTVEKTNDATAFLPLAGTTASTSANPVPPTEVPAIQPATVAPAREPTPPLSEAIFPAPPQEDDGTVVNTRIPQFA